MRPGGQSAVSAPAQARSGGGQNGVMTVLFLNGTVGVGKSTVADLISAREPGPHAVIDLDQIRRFRPAPAADVFNHELELRNLRALVRAYREEGARRLILAGVIEEASEVVRYADAVGGLPLVICRLTAPPDEIDRRLRERHVGDPGGLEWHRRRARELDAILVEAAVDDVVVETSGVHPAAVADQVRLAVGWD